MTLSYTQATQAIQFIRNGSLKDLADVLKAICDADFVPGNGTAGTGSASDPMVLDSNGDFVMPSGGIFGMSRAALAAAGTTAADAAVIAQQIVLVTASDGAKGVALPAAAATEGPILVVNTVNTTGASLLVYPVNGGNDQINGLAEDAAFTMAPGTSAWFIPTSATQWYVEQAVATTGFPVVNVTDAASYTVLAANSGRLHILPNFTATCTIALPAAADGLVFEFVSKAVAADAQDWKIQSPGAFLGGVIFLDTDDPADTVAPVFPNGSSNDFLNVVTPGAGTRLIFVCDGTNWIANGYVVSATTPAFADT